MNPLHLVTPAELIICKTNTQQPKCPTEYIKTSPPITIKLSLGMAQIWACCLPPASHPFKPVSAELPKHKPLDWKALEETFSKGTACNSPAPWLSQKLILMGKVGYSGFIFCLDCEGCWARRETLDAFFWKYHYTALSLLLISFVCTC